MITELTKYKAILFDVDGVIVDSVNAYSSLLKNLAESLGADINMEASFYKLNLGKRFEHWLLDLLPAHNHTKFVDEFLKQDKELAENEQINLLPGAKELLTKLKNYGIVIILVTTKSRVVLEQTLLQFKLSELIDYSVSGDEVKNFKPDPEGILKALEMFKLSNNDALFIGDTEHDLGAAKNAGVNFIGVNTGVFSSENWQALNVNYVDGLDSKI